MKCLTRENLKENIFQEEIIRMDYLIASGEEEKLERVAIKLKELRV